MALINNSKIFYVNSRDRVTGTDSDFLYQFKIPSESKFDKVCVLQMVIPKSYYLVTANESFTLAEDAKQVAVIMPVGNYTRKSFAATLQGVINSASPNGFTYTVTYPTLSTVPDTGKYTYTVTNNSGTQPVFIFDTSNDLWDHMGFGSGSTNSFATNILVSTQVINLQKENALYLHSDISNNGSDNILQEVFSNQSPDYSSIVFEQYNIEAYSKDLIGSSNNVFRFYLTDENDVAIDLNGQNFNLTLVMYRKNTVYDLIRNFLQLQVMKQ